MSQSDLDGRILACTLAALMPSPQFSLTSRKLLNARWRLASEMPLFALHLNAVEAPDPKGASGREWCYVEAQAELSAFLARCWPSVMLGGRPASWRRRLGILWFVADLERRIVRSTASLSPCQRQDGFHSACCILIPHENSPRDKCEVDLGECWQL